MSITNADMDTAKSYLDMCNGDVDAAVCTFFAQDGGPAPAPARTSAPSVLETARTMLGGGNDNMSEEDRAMQEALAMSMADAGQQPTSDEELIRRGLLASSVEGNSFAALEEPEPMRDEGEDDQQATNDALKMSMDNEPEQDEAMRQAMSMSMQEPAAAGAGDGVLAQFQEMCGVNDAEMARNYLDAFNGDLNAAVEMYMQSNGNSSAGAAGPSSQSVIGAGFASMYNEQFGLLHPQFSMDDYDGAVRAARVQGKLLIVYMHDAVEGAHFCKHLLSRELVYENIDRHFLFFGCNNVEGRSLGSKLLSSLGSGSDVPNPYLVVVAPAQPDKGIELIQDVLFSPQDFVIELQRVWNVHGKDLEAQGAQFASRESDRVVREMEKTEQDGEFERALAEDQAREQQQQAHQQQEAQAVAAAAAQQQVRVQEQQVTEQRHSQIVAARREACANLPAEPEKGVKPASKVKCSLPDGTAVTRRFHGADSVQDLYDWVAGQECMVEQDAGNVMELMCTYPRKVISVLG